MPSEQSSWTNSQPSVAGLHLSDVHGFPSSHVMGTNWQFPVAGLQVSSVQAAVSAQVFRTELHAAVGPSHRSVVQGSPSSQIPATLEYSQLPVVELQRTFSHRLPLKHCALVWHFGQVVPLDL